VPGDLDDIYILHKLRVLKANIDGKAIKLGNVLLLGIGGVNPHQSIRLLKKSLSRYIDLDDLIKILITHYPPYGILDYSESLRVHRGLGIINEVIDSLRPNFVLLGHPYRPMGICIYRDSLVINPGPFSEGFYLVINPETYEVSINALRRYCGRG